MRYENDQITCCGLRYIGHFNCVSFYVGGDTWGTDVPFDRIRDLVKLFPEIDWEDGKFLEILKGSYVRIGIDNNSKICSIRHIVKDIEYMVEVK